MQFTVENALLVLFYTGAKNRGALSLIVALLAKACLSLRVTSVLESRLLCMILPRLLLLLLLPLPMAGQPQQGSIFDGSACLCVPSERERSLEHLLLLLSSSGEYYLLLLLLDGPSPLRDVARVLLLVPSHVMFNLVADHVMRFTSPPSFPSPESLYSNFPLLPFWILIDTKSATDFMRKILPYK